MRTPRILLVVTSAEKVRGMPTMTGTWLEELAAPYYTFRDAKCDVTLASPKGGRAPIDSTSLNDENQTASTRRFQADSHAMALLESSVQLAGVDLESYDAVFFAGGHGTMEDFPNDTSVRLVVEHFYKSGKPVAAVCHGPACYVSARKPTGEPVMKGHRFTCFTDVEETNVGLAGLVPFMLETTLCKQGGIADTNAPFQAQVIVDLPILTGQNPASAIPLAEAVIHHVRTSSSGKAAA